MGAAWFVLPSLRLKLLSPPAANAKGMTARAPAALLAPPPAEQRAPMAASICSRCWITAGAGRSAWAARGAERRVAAL